MLRPYFLTSSPPSSVSHSKKGTFTSPNDVNLIVCKRSKLEIFLLTENGIALKRQENLFACIVYMELFRPMGAHTDLLFLCTETYEYSILSWDIKKNDFILEMQGTFQEREGRPLTNGPFGFIDSKEGMIVLALYQGWLAVLPLDIATFTSFKTSAQYNFRDYHSASNSPTKMNKKKDFYNIRLQELNPLSIVLDHHERTSFAILYVDTDSKCYVRTYKIRPEGLIEGYVKSTCVHPRSYSLIPLPQGGFIVLSTVSAQYVGNFGNPPIHMYKKEHTIKCWSPIDSNFARILIGEMHGLYSVLFLTITPTGIQNMQLLYIGMSTTCTTLTYLDNGFAFLGSHFGDSALIHLLEHPDATGNSLQVITKYTNIGPVLDLLLMEPRNQPGSRQLISCSGGFHDASLRVIRHGMEFKEIHFLESLSLTRVFAIGSQNTNTDHLIALSTDMKTLFLTTQTIEENDKKSPVEPGLSSQELIQVDLPLISEEPTFLLTQIEDEIIIQATLSGIYVYDFVTYTAITSWSLPVGSNLIDAYFSCTYFLAASGSTLYCLVLNNNTFFTLLNTKSFNSDISCIDLAPIANLASVGLWNGDVFLINVPSFELYDHVNLGEMCARSIRIAIWSEKLHFLCGLGNGQLISFECCVNKPGLNEKVEMHIGTQPIRLSRFQRDGKTLLFSCCDRPAVLSGSNTGKLLCSNINLENALDVCTFRNNLLGDELILAVTERGLFVGFLDPVDNLHVSTYTLGGEMARKIAHHLPSSALVVLTERMVDDDPELSSVEGFVRLYDDFSFELLSTYVLKSNETPQSICILSDSEQNSRILVGTAFEFRNEYEPKSGRILLFTVENSKLKLLNEISTLGAVYSLASIHHHLVAGINHRIQLYAIENETLIPKCGHHGNILILYLDTIGNYIIVGDIMKSVSMWMYQPAEDVLKLVARDPSPHWLTAIFAIDECHVLASDANHNIFIAKRNTEQEHDIFSNRMEIITEFHVGEFINRFIPGYLHPVKDCIVKPLITSASINGHIGVFGHVESDEDFSLLLALQHTLLSKLKFYFDYTQYRAFNNERKKVNAHGIIDGDIVELYLSLDEQTKKNISKDLSSQLKRDISVSLLTGKVEDIARLH